MNSDTSSRTAKNQRLAAALRRNVARRKAAMQEDVPAAAQVVVAEAYQFEDDEGDTTSPMGCCAGCR